MPTKAEIQSKLAEAFAGPLADTVKTFVFTSVDNTPTYDPSTGITSSHVDYPGLTGSFVDYNEKEIIGVNSVVTEEEKIRPTDVKLIALQNVLLVEPKMGDTVAVATGKTFKVMSWKQDPMSIAYTIQLRTMSDA